jgi:large subunit ribosomal protein L23
MELTIYDIIKGPLISDKAYRLNRTLNQLVLEVHVAATKPQIKNALERLFNVKVKEVRTGIRKYTKAHGRLNKRFVARPSQAKMKIAYVSLAEGHKLNLFEQAEVAPRAAEVEQA